MTKTAEKKAEKKDEKKKEMRKSLGSCKDFKELQEFLKKNAKERITTALDAALLKPTTYDQLLDLMKKKREELKANDYKTKSRIKSHIRFRENHDKWIFQKEKDNVQLIGKQ